MSTHEIMTISEKLLSQLKETMATMAKKQHAESQKSLLYIKSSRKLTQQVSEMVLQGGSHKHSPYAIKKSSIYSASGLPDHLMTPAPKSTMNSAGKLYPVPAIASN
jgi:hypothetical protein